MMSLRLAAIVYCLSMLSVSSALPFRDPGQGATGSYGRVHGQVANTQTGQSIVGSTLTLLPLSDRLAADQRDDDAGRMTETGADGRFEFDAVPPGRYILRAQALGFAPRSDLSLKYLDVSAGSLGPAISLYLVPAASVRGTVFDANGIAIGGATVTALMERGTLRQGTALRLVSRVRTDSAGNYVFSSLPAGRFRFFADPLQTTSHAAGLTSPNKTGRGENQSETDIRTFYPASSFLDAATPVELHSGQDVTAVDIQIRRSSVYSISGKVDVGEASGGVKLRLYPNSTEDTVALGVDVPTAANGYFSVSGLVPGSYRLELVGANLFSRTSVEVGASDVNNISLAPADAVSVLGKVTCDGCDNIDVSTTIVGLTPIDMTAVGATVQSVAVSQGGTFRLDRVTRCRYVVQLSPPAGTYPYSIAFNQQNPRGGELNLSDGGGQLSIVLRTGASQVTGNLRTDGEATGNMSDSRPSVFLLKEPDGSGISVKPKFGQITPDGFIVRNLIPGTYLAFATIGFDVDLWTQSRFVDAMRASAIKVSLSDRETKQIDLPLLAPEEILRAAERVGIF